jgi:hypothetical protein
MHRGLARSNPSNIEKVAWSNETSIRRHFRARRLLDANSLRTSQRFVPAASKFDRRHRAVESCSSNRPQSMPAPMRLRPRYLQSGPARELPDGEQPDRRLWLQPADLANPARCVRRRAKKMLPAVPPAVSAVYEKARQSGGLFHRQMIKSLVAGIGFEPMTFRL